MPTEQQSAEERLDELAESFVTRYRRGERPSLSEYARQHPALADRIHEVFPTLVAMEQVDCELKDAANLVDGIIAANQQPRIDHLGDFHIIREVGRGGMGVVYEAEQESLGRRVALKLLPKSLLLDEKHRKRFEREARAAAKLHHTNIVPVFGVGEQDGLRYYTMQFIPGLPLDEVIAEVKRLRADSTANAASKEGANVQRDEAALIAESMVTGSFNRTVIRQRTESQDQESSAVDPQEPNENTSSSPEASRETTTGRLSETFVSGSTGLGADVSKAASRAFYFQNVAKIGVQVADALQYAHAQGILHRDIKPGNLLLDTCGTAWVTDFGLAKIEDHQNLTGTGEVVGTLRYMAPEMFNGKADERSDVYSLGLTLYEVLALRPAFDESNRGKLVRQVMHDSPPRLRTVDSHIPRDLETIIHKSIDRNPERRYTTADHLRDDLERFLNNEPIRARRISPIARFSRWCKRNPLGATIVTLLVVGFLASITTAAAFLRLAADKQRLAEQARQEKDRAQTEVAIAKAVIDFLNNDLLASGDLNKQPDPDTKLRTLLDRAAERIGERFAQQPLVAATLHHTIGITYQSLGEYEKAKTHITRAVEIRREVLGPEHSETLGSMVNVGLVLLNAGDFAGAEEYFRKLLATQRRVLGDEHDFTLATMSNLATAIGAQRRYADMEQVNRTLLKVLKRVQHAEHPLALVAMHNLAIAINGQGRYREAEALHRKVLAVRRQVLGSGHPDTARSIVNLANTLMGQQRNAEAEILLREGRDISRKVLGTRHPDSLRIIASLAKSIRDQGKMAEAEELFRKALEGLSEVLGPTHSDTLQTQMHLVMALKRAGHLAEAEKVCHHALTLKQSILPAEHPDVVGTKIQLAYLIDDQKRFSEAEPLYREILQDRRSKFGVDHKYTLATMTRLARVIEAQGRHKEAEKLYRQLVQLRRQKLGMTHDQTLQSMAELAVTLARQERFSDAEELFRAILETRRSTLGEDHSRTLQAMGNLSAAIVSQARYNDARQLLEAQLAIEQRKLSAADPAVLATTKKLAEVCSRHAAWLLLNSAGEQRKAVQAVELARQSVKLAPREDMFPVILGWALYRQQEYDEALKMLDKALTLGQWEMKEARTAIVRAMILWKQGKRAEARTSYARGGELIERHSIKDMLLVWLRTEAKTLMKGKVQDK